MAIFFITSIAVSVLAILGFVGLSSTGITSTLSVVSLVIGFGIGGWTLFNTKIKYD